MTNYPVSPFGTAMISKNFWKINETKSALARLGRGIVSRCVHRACVDPEPPWCSSHSGGLQSLTRAHGQKTTTSHHTPALSTLKTVSAPSHSRSVKLLTQGFRTQGQEGLTACPWSWPSAPRAEWPLPPFSAAPLEAQGLPEENLQGTALHATQPSARWTPVLRVSGQMLVTLQRWPGEC